MSSNPDELEINQFYKFLQTTWRDTFEKAQDFCWLVCIPQSSCLRGVSFSQNFTDYHILRPSPYFQGQFLTLHASEKTVTIENDHLITTEGFPGTEAIQILSEELGYNKDYKSYRILIIERPLDPSVQHMTVSSQSSSPDISGKFSFDDCHNLLWSYPSLKAGLTKLDEDIDKFLVSYMILKDYLDDTSRRLQSICNSTLMRCLATNHQLQSDARLTDVINAAIESYVVGKVHSKLYPVICDQYRQEDTTMRLKLQQLSSLTGSELGVQPQFLAPLTTATEELGRLDGLVTPYEKLQCVRVTLERIKDDITVHTTNHTLGVMPKAELRFTSDDLIPILMSVLCECGSECIISNLYYMEHFTWSLSAKNEFSFCLATLKACVEYSRQVNIHNLRVRYSSMGDQMEGKVDPVTSAGPAVKEADPTTSPRSCLSQVEKQLDKMARMLEQSSSSLSHHLSLKRSDDHGQPKSKNTGLGSFLSALQEDDLGPSFGKQ